MIETKSMPSSYPAEKAIISSMLQSASIASRGRAEGIDTECFWHPTTRILSEALGTIQRNDDGEADLITLVQQLQDSGDLDRCGGPAEVYEVYSYSPSASGWTAWCDTLREMKARRLAITASQSLSEAVDSSEAILTAKTALEALQRAITGQRRAIGSKQASAEFVSQFEANYHAGDIAGQSTGIECLDQICGGMRAGELWVVGGKPSRGKSVLMLQIAAEVIGAGKPVAIFSLEMMAHEVIGRLVSTTARLDYGSITQPRTANKSQLSILKQTIGNLSTAPLWIDATSNQTIDTIVGEAERIRDMHGSLDLVVVDYLQLIRGNRGKNESREEEVARVSGGLKQLAKLLKCPVLSATQLNEANQTRESRAIEQDADALLYICDDGIKVGKLRNGKRDDVLPLLLDGRIQRFCHS
jgi:replicative DNA helicase